MSEINEKIKSLKQQQEQAKENFKKCQVAIEMCEELIKDNKDNKK